VPVSFIRLSKGGRDTHTHTQNNKNPCSNRNDYQGISLGGKLRPALKAEYSAVPVVPNVKVRTEAQHSTPPPLSLHYMLRESFTFTWTCEGRVLEYLMCHMLLTS